MNQILNFDEFVNESVILDHPTRKKAVKLFNIKWDLSGVEPKKAIDLEMKLPKAKGFTTDGDFDVAEKVPALLKKKYGYDIKDFSFNEYKIVEDLESLLYLCLKSGETKSKLFNVGGRLSSQGEELFNRLVKDVRRRKEMEKEGADEYKMPKHLDEIMLGIENIYELEWDSCTPEVLLKPVKDEIESRRETYKPKKHSKLAFDEEEDDEDVVREIDDDEVPQDVKDDDARRRIEDEEEEGDEDPVSEDTTIFFDEESKRYYFGDTTWYMTKDSNGEFRVYDDGEYEGKYCGSLETLKKQDDPLNYVLQGL